MSMLAWCAAVCAFRPWRTPFMLHSDLVLSVAITLWCGAALGYKFGDEQTDFFAGLISVVPILVATLITLQILWVWLALMDYDDRSQPRPDTTPRASLSSSHRILNSQMSGIATSAFSRVQAAARKSITPNLTNFGTQGSFNGAGSRPIGKLVTGKSLVSASFAPAHKNVADCAPELQHISGIIASMRSHEVERFLPHLNYYDQKTVAAFVALINAELLEANVKGRVTSEAFDSSAKHNVVGAPSSSQGNAHSHGDKGISTVHPV